MSKQYHPKTIAIHEGFETSEAGENSEAIYLTSSFKFKSAKQAKQRFTKEEPGNIYSRFTNPNTKALELRLAKIESAQDAVVTSSGMAAIFATIMSLVKAGDHIVVSSDMFGSTMVLLKTIVPNYGIEVEFANFTNLDDWQRKIKRNTKLFLFENPSNPCLFLLDTYEIAKICKKNNIILVVDSCLSSPVFQKPLTQGANLVIHSATKYIDGQGRALGGAIMGSTKLLELIKTFLRNSGACLSPFNAWIMLKGLATLNARMQIHSENGLKLAQWLKKQKSVIKVNHLALKDHPHHSLAKKLLLGNSGVVSFEVEGGIKNAWRIIDSCKLHSITANFGDVKSTITHPSTTTHNRLSDDEKKIANISDGLIRISAGLEDIQDIINDLKL